MKIRKWFRENLLGKIIFRLVINGRKYIKKFFVKFIRGINGFVKGG